MKIKWNTDILFFYEIFKINTEINSNYTSLTHTLGLQFFSHCKLYAKESLGHNSEDYRFILKMCKHLNATTKM